MTRDGAPDTETVEQTEDRGELDPRTGDDDPGSLRPQIGGPRAHEVVDARKAKIFEIIAAPLAKRDGFRHLWLGDSGMGKTVANQLFVQWLLQHKLVDLILTVDDKSRWQAQYQGTFRANPAHLRREPPRMGEPANHIVFRGIALTQSLDDGVDPSDVASMGWTLVRLKPCNVLLNLDELADATNGHQSWDEETIPQLYRKGRGVGLSVSATTQLPQILPREAFGLSDTIVVFRLSGRETEYLRRYRVISEDDALQIQSLKVGEFRLFRKSFPPDPTVYKFVR